MIDTSTRPARRRWLRSRKGAVAGIGLGAALVLSPLAASSLWAQDARPAQCRRNPSTAIPAIPGPATMLPQQSFAPLVKRVLPAVVNISVTETAKADQMSDQLSEGFRGSPFDDMLRRFFDQQQGGQQQGDDDENDGGTQRHFHSGPQADGVKRIALGSGLHHRCRRAHRHQQPRRRRGRQGRGDAAGRQQIHRQDHRPRPAHRPRAC